MKLVSENPLGPDQLALVPGVLELPVNVTDRWAQSSRPLLLATTFGMLKSSVIVAEAVKVQPLAALVTVTVYVPGMVTLTFWLLPNPSDH